MEYTNVEYIQHTHGQKANTYNHFTYVMSQLTYLRIISSIIQCKIFLRACNFIQKYNFSINVLNITDY